LLLAGQLCAADAYRLSVRLAGIASRAGEFPSRRAALRLFARTRGVYRASAQFNSAKPSRREPRLRTKSRSLRPSQRPPSHKKAKRFRLGALLRGRGGGSTCSSEAGGDFRGMFEHALWGIFQTTPEGEYIRANPALAAIYGYDSPESLMKEVTDVGRQLYVEPTRRDEFVRLVQESGSLADFESQIRRRDGTVIWISESCREVRDAEGKLLLYEGTVEDITARKQVEADLLAARALAEQSNKAKSVFLANMSHELRTPLNAILGFSELMEQELFGPIGDKRYVEFASDIHRSGRHLLDIIGNILDLAKVETGNLGLDEREVDVAEVMRASERLIAEIARRRNVAFKVRAPRPSFERGEIHPGRQERDAVLRAGGRLAGVDRLGYRDRHGPARDRRGDAALSSGRQFTGAAI
jgi:PAS domain S-box-containing protein